MRLSVACPISGLSVYTIVKRLSDGTYFTTATQTFGVWVAEANHRITLVEDTQLDGQYHNNFDAGTNWQNGPHLIYFYHTSVDAANVIGTKIVVIHNGEIIDSQSYSFLARILGLSKENMYLDDTVYTEGKMVSCRVRLFDTYPFDPSSDTPIAIYRCTISYTLNKLKTWKMDREWPLVVSV